MPTTRATDVVDMPKPDCYFLIMSTTSKVPAPSPLAVFGRELIRIAIPLLVCLAACGDDSSIAPDAAFDARTPDAATLDASFDAGSALDCEELAGASGWSFCSGSAAECSLVFEDSTGCAAACRAVGLECVESYEDVAGMCDYDRDLPALGCADSGHGSDYCVCGVAPGPDGGVPDGGVDVDSGPTPDGGVDASAPDAAPFDGGSGGLHEALLGELVGFGQGTTGGAGGPIVLVTTLADSGPGSLREALATAGPAWVRFMVDGVISLSSNIDLTSDKTVDGRGANITIAGGGLFVQGGTSNVIINNVKIRDTPNDLIRFYNGGSHMWVHHCDLSNGGDGAFDATDGTSNITVSYTHIFDHDKAMLVGAGSDDGDGEGMRWTGHHNWYEDVVQRLPFIRFGRAHSFNNLIEWRSGTAMSVRLTPAQMLVENNIFAPQTNVGHKLISERAGRGAVRIVGNLERPLSGDVIEFTEFMPETVFSAAAAYPYVAEVADDGLISRLRTQAGWQDVPFPE